MSFSLSLRVVGVTFDKRIGSLEKYYATQSGATWYIILQNSSVGKHRVPHSFTLHICFSGQHTKTDEELPLTSQTPIAQNMMISWGTTVQILLFFSTFRFKYYNFLGDGS